MAAVAATWYPAFLLAMQPPLAGAVAMLMLFPVLLMLCVIGFFFLPGNLLTNLRLELPDSVYTFYWAAFLLSVVLLHVWLYRSWRWSALALLAAILCISSYGCYAHNPAWHDL